MNYWLFKSEPSEVSVDHLAKMPNQTIAWFGVRNYQARNFMKDSMRIGDKGFFYHSSCPQPGIVGIVEVVSGAYVDDTQFDEGSKYYDPRADRQSPRWFNVDVRLIERTRLIALHELRQTSELVSMRLLAKGNRLSITPVTPFEWKYIVERLLAFT